MESLHGFSGGAQVVAGWSDRNILVKKSLCRGRWWRSGHHNGGQAKQTSSGILALQESNRGWAYKWASGHQAMQDTTETPAETPAIGPKGLYCSNSDVTIRGRVERAHGQGRAGMPRGIQSGGGGKFWVDCGGKALEARSGRSRFGSAKECAEPTGTWQREGVRWPWTAHRWGVVVPGCGKWVEGIFMPWAFAPDIQQQHSRSFLDPSSLSRR